MKQSLQNDRCITKQTMPLAQTAAWLNAHPVCGCTALAAVCVLVIETLARHSLLAAFSFLFSRPLYYGYNVLMVLSVLLPGLLLAKRRAWITTATVLWLALGIVNGVLLTFRTTPLGATDFSIFFSVLPILNIYMPIWQIILIVIASLLALAALIVFIVRSRKQTRLLRRGGIAMACIVALLTASTWLYHETGLLPEAFGHLPTAYSDYGFVYCFTVSLFDRGIDRPENYTESTVDEILDEITDDPQQEQAAAPSVPTEKPNILFLQLESFFDVKHLKTADLEYDPIPTFTALKEEYPSGYLSVPTIGAGTVNTEFEVITGMSLDYFGTGEYPYKTVLLSKTCESLCYNLREEGYTSHAIHNNTATFYHRNDVFANLGFDTFTSIEFMQNVEYTPLGWAKDAVLTQEITKALDATEGRDLIYTISVQPHGKYPDSYDGLEESELALLPSSTLSQETADDESLAYEFNYYLEQLREVDAFLADLTQTLANYDEPVVLVLYGDHLPNLPITDADLENGDVYETEYIIWSNFPLEAADQDLQAYQLSAHVLELLGMDNGYLTKLHQNCSEDANYLESLEALEYDMLFGDMEIYGGVSPYAPTELQLGTQPVSVTKVAYVGQTVFVYGENFTPFSQVFLDDEALDTVFVDNNTLMIDLPDENGTFTVQQVAKSGLPLSSSAPFTLP